MLIDYQADQIVHQLDTCARPVEAEVSDVGSYIVHDCLFGSELRGEVVAIGTDGRERYRKRYSANVFNLGLSKCGRYAAVQTANAPSKDGNVLEILDLAHSCVVFSVQPPPGWADAYSFDVQTDGNLRALVVEHKRLGKFRYSSTGEFLDTEALQVALLGSGDCSMRIYAARDLLKEDATPENAEKALRAVDAALLGDVNDRPDLASIAHRVRGESYQLLGKMAEALSAYEQALSLNPKVGVQKRVAGLRKALAAD